MTEGVFSLSYDYTICQINQLYLNNSTDKLMFYDTKKHLQPFLTETLVQLEA